MALAENRNRLRSALLFGAVALAGVAVVLYAWRLPPFTTPIQSTENALVNGQVTIISPQRHGLRRRGAGAGLPARSSKGDCW